MLSAAIWFACAFAIAALVSGCAIAFFQPLWRQYALAKPNARSSHKQPTPQGGGIAVLLGIFFACAVLPVLGWTAPLASVLTAALTLGILGGIDDIRGLPAGPRFVVQAIAAIFVLVLLPQDFRVVSTLPWWLERGVMFFGLVWFINLTNFMDGIDWMTVAETVPLAAAVTIFAAFDLVPRDTGFAAAALCGAMLGFAPFNRPIARLFLGDVGSLPIGLLLGWILIRLGERHLAAALLLPLYYLADSSITLLGRLLRGERVTEAHRCHFYQQAVDNGMPVRGVIAHVVLLNLILIALATITIFVPLQSVKLGALGLGCALTIGILVRFARWSEKAGPRAYPALPQQHAGGNTKAKDIQPPFCKIEDQ
jgi:UDP-N-acetylmuramyl pentapeptide phosphotransferase/UDP-N-acetylglucosamine-1-phosphate transferase